MAATAAVPEDRAAAPRPGRHQPPRLRWRRLRRFERSRWRYRRDRHTSRLRQWRTIRRRLGRWRGWCAARRLRPTRLSSLGRQRGAGRRCERIGLGFALRFAVQRRSESARTKLRHATQRFGGGPSVDHHWPRNHQFGASQRTATVSGWPDGRPQSRLVGRADSVHARQTRSEFVGRLAASGRRPAEEAPQGTPANPINRLRGPLPDAPDPPSRPPVAPPSRPCVWSATATSSSPLSATPTP